MLNTDEFTNRLKKIMDYYDLSAAVFADKIGVQRSSISHLLSGRNKPSLDFILKITSIFKEVDLYWLINGKGSFPQKVESSSSTSTPTLFPSNEVLGKKIQRIVVFYSDGTFDEYLK
ncbi:MAG: helix-turn-helix transcriptional regulator [Flavobacteriia bacterium]|nr:helix-turn-helix transcriptional regulator [Flavobacteriia bacterium]OIP45141.1 MAG: transcriptional regulator [Flavobacteriaceae bacterium CG2_30_31_66]PIV95337.1 MAG: transcriptional regulator [Flavobacteriaceae bacterium CG17_big_fil_post_rev_8_21_14_2_50_31_13]PIX14426.1 MAG: transcriptional regulator [Flavobacteriaceae bacterium CG_4_8_14_3_um_filter_31_8]PIY15928.1 MAG: transcriptional regulator [Flavobacteriaceae bacterium CG_4_10_14_3_um_filter_31_253]PIZ11771.1 MAG: transcriptional